MEKQSGQGTMTQRLENMLFNLLSSQSNQFPVQVGLPNEEQMKTSETIQFLRAMQFQYEHYLAALLSSFREVSEDDLKDLKEHKKDLFCREESALSPLIELGDHVKFTLKHRQFKQFTNSGWNERMKTDYDQVGIVIGLLIANPSEVVVFFPQSGQSWVIHKAALEIVEDTSQDGTNVGLSFNKLQVGDSVEINNNLSEKNILLIQAYYSLSDLGLKLYRGSLRKILAFDRKGAAYVSVTDLESTKIHSSLLRIANKFHTPAKQKTPSKEKRVSIKDNIEDLILLGTWNASHTRIVGEQAKILKETSNGICQIEVLNKTYYVSKDYFVTTKKQKEQKKSRRRRQSGDRKKSLNFPFKVGDILQLDMKSVNQSSKDLHEIAEELYVVFVGYCKNGMISVSVNWPSLSRDFSFSDLNAPMVLWKKSLEKSSKSYEEWQKKRNEIQVKDYVSLYGAQHPKFVQATLNKLLAPEHIIQAITSNVQLVAFNDDTDEAVLRLKNGKFYACPAEYVCPATDESKLEPKSFSTPDLDQSLSVVCNKQITCGNIRKHSTNYVGYEASVETRLSKTIETSLFEIWMYASRVAKVLLRNDRLENWEIKENAEEQNESWNTTICIDKIPINYGTSFLRTIAANIKSNHQCETDLKEKNLLIVQLSGCSGKITIKVSSLHNEPETKLALKETAQQPFQKITEENEETLKVPPANETGSSPDPVQADCGDELTKDNTNDKNEKLNKSKNKGIGKKDIQPSERPHCSNTGPVFVSIDQDDTDRIPFQAENDDDDDSSDEDDVNVSGPPFIPSQPENEFESLDDSNREVDETGEDINAGENGDGEFVTRQATLTLNYRTNEVVMKGNLRSNPRVREEGGNGLMRQNSQVEESNRGESQGIYGGNHIIYNISGSTFNGPNYINSNVANHPSFDQEG